jgi:hypothetical protein
MNREKLEGLLDPNLQLDTVGGIEENGFNDSKKKYSG